MHALFLRNRKWSLRHWLWRCASCHSSTITSDSPQTPVTFSALKWLLRVCWRTSTVTAMAPSRTHHSASLLRIIFIRSGLNTVVEFYYFISFRSEFAVQKLKKSGAKNGTFLLRHSPKEFDKYFLMVCLQVTHTHLCVQTNV